MTDILDKLGGKITKKQNLQDAEKSINSFLVLGGLSVVINGGGPDNTVIIWVGTLILTALIMGVITLFFIMLGQKRGKKVKSVQDLPQAKFGGIGVRTAYLSFADKAEQFF